MAPSLEKHRGCDIIDIHPGSCLWSKKLHDFLNPRAHLLMEPEEKYYEPFIKPLVDAPGSAFRHTFLSGAHPKSYFQSYDRIFKDDKLLPTRKTLDANDPQLRRPNNTLLVTGTLGRRYTDNRVHVNNVHSANLLLNHMVQAAQTNSLFHGYGLVRMLFWQPEDTKATVLPDTTTTRAGFTLGLEATAEMVEVAGRDRYLITGERDLTRRAVYKYRFPEMEQIGANRVLGRMEEQGIHMPVHRRGFFHDEAIKRKESGQNLTPVEADQVNCTKLKEDVSVEDAIAAHEEKWSSFSTIVKRLGKRREAMCLPYDYKFPEAYSKQLSELDKTRMGPYIELCGRQVALEAELVKTRTKMPAAVWDDLRKRLGHTSSGLRESLRKIANQTLHGSTQIFFNELMAFHSSLLQFDRRPYEPLALEKDEFWPQYHMYLVDIQPHEDNLADEIATPASANSAMREVLTSLFQLTATPLPAALDRLGPNAAQDLLPDVPEVFDVSKGGRLDLEDLAVRLLTAEMLRSLTRAYLEWPFRPSAYDPTTEGVEKQ